MTLAVFVYLTVEAGTVVRGNDELEGSLVVVETVALSNGLHPDAIAMLLDMALSLNAGKFIYFYSISRNILKGSWFNMNIVA